jgi:hypothetical protein
VLCVCAFAVAPELRFGCEVAGGRGKRHPYGIFAGSECRYWTIRVTVVVCVAVSTPLALPLAVIVT